MANEAKINEIFASIQGEGVVVGYKQLFIRFCGCNLNCGYCDTEFKNGIVYTPQSLYEKISTQYKLKTFHSISLTGGEPLLSYKFLKEFLPLVKGKVKIYLETNATLTDNFSQVKDYIDIVAADIKLPSATGLGVNIMENNFQFLRNCSGINTFAKIVFDENITDEEIDFCAGMAKNIGIELILQPKMIGAGMSVNPEFCEKILDKFISVYPDTRLIPQVHKFLNVR